MKPTSSPMYEPSSPSDSKEDYSKHEPMSKDLLEMYKWMKETLTKNGIANWPNRGLGEKEGRVDMYIKIDPKKESVVGDNKDKNWEYNGFFKALKDGENYHFKKGIIKMEIKTNSRIEYELWGSTSEPDPESWDYKYKCFETKEEFERVVKLIADSYKDEVGPNMFDPLGKRDGGGYGAFTITDKGALAVDICELGIFKKDGTLTLRFGKDLKKKLGEKFKASEVKIEFEGNCEKMNTKEHNKIKKPSKMRKKRLFLKNVLKSSA